MHRLILSAALVFSASSGVLAGQPFDVSLSYSAAGDLSPYYREVIREAAQFYRGDYPSGMSLMWYDQDGALSDPVFALPFASVSLHSVRPNQTMKLTATAVRLGDAFR